MAAFWTSTKIIRTENHNVGGEEPRHHYEAFGFAISSDVVFPELKAGLRAEAYLVGRPLKLRIGRVDRRPAEPHLWVFSSRLPDGEPWLSAARLDGGYLLRFNEIADFFVDRDGTEVALCHAYPETASETLRHLVLDQVVPAALSLRGVTALHAAAVATPSGVCAFLGPAGSGKSTLAASFSLAGYHAFSDDCLVLDERERFFAVPGYPGMRLWKDSRRELFSEDCATLPVAHFTSKRRVQGEPEFPHDPEPLKMIYWLERSVECDSPTVSDAAGGDALMKLVSCSFFLDLADRAMLAEHFRALGRLAASVPLRVLRIPDDFSALSDVRRAILVDMAS